MVHDIEKRDLTYEDALDLLKRGNKRFVASKTKEYDALDRELLKENQNPFCVVLACSDSRVTPEIIFDQGLGSLFVIRNAGNIVSTKALGSIEYAVENLEVPLIVVCGHSSCGAMTAAFESAELSGNLKKLISMIDTSKDDNLDTLSKYNIDLSLNKIEENEVVKKHGAKVVGAYYNIDTGEVEFK